MIWRTYNTEDVVAATAQVADDLKGLPVADWVDNESNIALRNTFGDVALFEYRQPEVYCGHYFFKSRGKAAVDTALEILDEIFSSRYPVSIIIGFTPLDKKGAVWLSRRIGFISHGDADIDGRPHRVFVMTKKEHLDE